MKPTLDNIDQWLFDALEGNLSPAQEQALEDFRPVFTGQVGIDERLHGQRLFRRQQALRRAQEERGAKGLLQRFDMASGRRLGEPKRAGGARQGAGFEDGEKGAVMVPADLIGAHSILYTDCTIFGNSEYLRSVAVCPQFKHRRRP